MTAPVSYPNDYGSVAPGGHCGVLAVAILSGRTFREAWDALTPRKGRWTGGTRHNERIAVLRSWGVPFRATLHMTGADYRFCGGKSPLSSYDAILPRCSVATFARRYAKPGVTYMLRIKRHVLTLRDGYCVDQTECCPVERYSLRRSIVTQSVERI